MLISDGHLQSDGIFIQDEAFGVQGAAAADGQQSLRGTERRLDKDLRHVSRLVGILIRDKGDQLLFNLAGWWPLTTTHPAGELALVAATKLVSHLGCDPVATANGSLKCAHHRLFL